MKTLLAALFCSLLLISNSGCRKFDNVSDPSDTTSCNTNYSMLFNGRTSYMEVPSTPELNLCEGSYTIETWAFFNEYYGGWQVLLAKDNMDSNTEWLLTADGPTHRFRFQTRDFSTVLYSTTPVMSGRWYHLAAVQDFANNTVKLYVDGVLECERNLVGRIVTTNYPIRFGTRINDITAGSPWYVVDGQMDEVRIWNVARTAEQINSNKNKTLKGNESGLVAYWSFDEGKGTKAVDHTSHGHDAAMFASPFFMITNCPVK